MKLENLSHEIRLKIEVGIVINEALSDCSCQRLELERVNLLLEVIAARNKLCVFKVFIAEAAIKLIPAILERKRI